MMAKYSADDIKELAREYLIDSPLTDTLMPELVLSSFTTWLKQRETPTSDVLQFETGKEARCDERGR